MFSTFFKFVALVCLFFIELSVNYKIYRLSVSFERKKMNV